jgi:hypothetical protein
MTPACPGGRPSPSGCRRLYVAAGFVLAIATRGGAAAAAEGPPKPCTCETVDRTAHRHDGFFMRAESGLVLYRAGVSGSATGRTEAQGLGQAAGLSFGGTVRPGLVLGGSLWATRIDPTFVEHGMRVTPDDDSVKITEGRIGPFLDFYPDPTRGFHAETGLSLAVAVESDTKGNSIKPASIGAAASFALGQELFIGEQLSLGLLARLTVGAMARSVGGHEERTFFEAPELLLTTTYH